MQNSTATLSCSNPRCQAGNPPDYKFCHKCRTPLIKRYLRALGSEIDAYKAGDILKGRYLVTGNRILLDTKPALPVETAEEIPEAIVPYLKLSPYKLHIPQVYGSVSRDGADSGGGIWLLEEIPVYSGGAGDSLDGQLMPKLLDAWKNAPPMRQINWLWQMAQLWQPMVGYGIASTLLIPQLLRVEGSIIRLLECVKDQKQSPGLSHLGQRWLEWFGDTDSVVTQFVQQVCQKLIKGEIKTPEALLERLEKGIATYARSQSCTYQIATVTDTGPSRRRNEDACLPESGTVTHPISGDAVAMAIVCDGIGGHEGGDVASRLAIETLQEQVEKLSATPQNWHPSVISEALENAIVAANDRISQRNDSEQRQDRKRMGTTLVMSVARDLEVYIGHVGDSRAYRITRTGCHQLTLDDDLASREVRLGYSIYRDAVRHASAGALVQALGMGSSVVLHPTVQRFLVDEDCIFLLCSDGLTDNDRVEQYWEKEIVPILDGAVDLATATQRLLQLANSQNGHDNVTVGLVYCQVTRSQMPAPQATAAAPVTQPENEEPEAIVEAEPPPVVSAMKTQEFPSRRSSQRPWLIPIAIAVLAGLGALALWWILANRGSSNTGTQPLQPGQLRQFQQDIPGTQGRSPLVAKQTPNLTVPRGSIVQLQQQTGNAWQVQVCTTPPQPQTQPIQAGQISQTKDVVLIEPQQLANFSQVYAIRSGDRLPGCPTQSKIE